MPSCHRNVSRESNVSVHLRFYFSNKLVNGYCQSKQPVDGWTPLIGVRIRELPEGLLGQLPYASPYTKRLYLCPACQGGQLSWINWEMRPYSEYSPVCVCLCVLWKSLFPSGSTKYKRDYPLVYSSFFHLLQTSSYPQHMVSGQEIGPELEIIHLEFQYSYKETLIFLTITYLLQ